MTRLDIDCDGGPERFAPARRPRSRRGSTARFVWLDAVLLAVIGAVIAFVAYRINTGLHYRWDWSVVATYTVRINQATGAWEANLLLIGLLTTIRIVVWAALLALIVGVAIGLCRVSSIPFLRLAARAYVDFVRGIPPLVIIFVIFYFISSQIIPLTGIESALRGASPGTLAVVEFLFGPPRLVPAFISATVCLALFEAAYVAEIVRAGIQSVERGQWEAARSLGLSPASTMRDVILPQAMQRMLPPLAGQFISLIKDSSIASLISVQELAFMAAQVSASTSRIFEVWIAVAGMYFVMCFGLSTAVGALEKRLARRLR